MFIVCMHVNEVKRRIRGDLFICLFIYIFFWLGGWGYQQYVIINEHKIASCVDCLIAHAILAVL